MEGSRQQVIQDVVREGTVAGRDFVYQVVSQSMAPFIIVGDRVHVRSVALTELRPGDIVSLAATDGGFVTHRYLGQVNRNGSVGLLAKGDCSLVPDPIWPNACLVGRVESISRAHKRIDLIQGREGIWGRFLGVVAMSNGVY